MPGGCGSLRHSGPGPGPGPAASTSAGGKRDGGHALNPFRFCILSIWFVDSDKNLRGGAAGVEG